MEKEVYNNSWESESGDSVETRQRDFRSYLEETPIVLPLLHACHPSTALAADLHDSPPIPGPSHLLSPHPSSDFPLSEMLDGNWRDCSHKIAEGSLSSGRSLSVSFGDVTVCGRVGEDGTENTTGVSMTSPLTLDDLPYIDDLILSAASPVLGPKDSKLRPKSLASVFSAFPEWLANKGRFGSLSSLVSKSSLQDVTEGSLLHRDARGRQGLKSFLHGSRLTIGDHHPRVLQPSISLGAFGDWNDVENPTLTVCIAPSTENNSVLEVIIS